MLEMIIGIIPVEFKPMSIITLILLIMLAYILTHGQKEITKELKSIEKNHIVLKNTFETTRQKINNEFAEFMKSMAEINQSNKFILTSINEIKQDLRDIRNKKGE